MDEKLAHGSIRFSLSRYTTEAEVRAGLGRIVAAAEAQAAVRPAAVMQPRHRLLAEQLSSPDPGARLASSTKRAIAPSTKRRW